jgi:hypothetical protein
MSLRLLLIRSGGLEILAGLLALISLAPVVSLLLGVPVDWIAAILTGLFGAGVFALGLACLKARDDIQSPAGLAVSIGITSYNVPAAVAMTWTATGSGLGGLLLWGAGIVHSVFGVLFLLVSREQSDNQMERGSVDRALFVNQHPSVLSRQSR